MKKKVVEIGYKPRFLKQLKKLPQDLQDDVKSAIRRFQEDPDDPTLRLHKLHGHLEGAFSFSVNYSYRIIFDYGQDGRVLLLKVGDHSLYR